MNIIGLTGSIGTGKSTVASLFQKLGARVVDLDELAHEVIYPHRSAWTKIVECFGTEILNEDSTIDRQKLAQIVFDDHDKLELLNQIVHPAIFQEDARLTSELIASDSEAMIVKDIPLLYESGMANIFDKTVVVYTSEQRQLDRLIKKGFTKEHALQRIRAQLSVLEKVKLADLVINNNGSFESTKRQVEKAYCILRENQ